MEKIEGKILDLQVITTFKGAKMATFSLESKKIIVFPKKFQEYEKIIQENRDVVVFAKKDESLPNGGVYVLQEMNIK